MGKLDNVFTVDNVNDVSEKILKSTIDKITNALGDSFYNEISSFLYDHYSNSSDKIKDALINEMSDAFINDPANNKFKALRDKIFKENKDEILEYLTNDAIYQSVEKVILEYTHKNYIFNWQWKDGIYKFIKENWDLFKNDERINMKLNNDIDRLNAVIVELKRKLNDIKESAE